MLTKEINERKPTFRKGLTLDLFWIFFLDIFLVTLRGYLSIPATRAWLQGIKGLKPTPTFISLKTFENNIRKPG